MSEHESLGDNRLDLLGAGQPLRPAAFKMRSVISCGWVIRDK